MLVQRVVTRVTCDECRLVTTDEASVTEVNFVLGGTEYDMDLCKECEALWRTYIDPWLAIARVRPRHRRTWRKNA